MKHPDATKLEQALATLACPTTQHAAIIMAERDQLGRERYGQDVDANPLTAAQWAQHALEECADGLKYAIRAREEARKMEMELEALRVANAALVDRNKELLELAKRLADFPLEEFGWQTRKDSQPLHGWNDYTLYVSDIRRARNLVAKAKGQP